MAIALIALGGIILFIASIIVIIDAFKSAPWKGILGFFCGLYTLYYMFAEFQHEKKQQIIIMWVVGLVLYIIGFSMGGMQAMQGAQTVATP